MLTKRQILKILDWDTSPTLDDSRGLFARIIKVAREAERQEREACAQLCEVEYAACWHNSAMAAAKAAERCATAIRLRGGK